MFKLIRLVTISIYFHTKFCIKFSFFQVMFPAFNLGSRQDENKYWHFPCSFH